MREAGILALAAALVAGLYFGRPYWQRRVITAPLATFTTVPSHEVSPGSHAGQPSASDAAKGAALAAPDDLGKQVRDAKRWKPRFQQKLDQRVFEAPDDLIDYLRADNKKNGFPGEPAKVAMPMEMQDMIRAVVQRLPPVEANLLKKRLVGVTVVDNLGSGGYTESVLDETDRPIGGFVVLDKQVFGLTASQYMSLRENSAFEKGPFKIELHLKDSAEHEVPALDYILTHELAHVVSINSNAVSPDWDTQIKASDFEDYKYLQLSWEFDAIQKKIRPHLDRSTVTQSPIHFFKDERLPNALIPKMYDWLDQSDFPNLYASASVNEDFAECAAIFFFTRILKGSFTLEIYENGQLKSQVSRWWERANLKRKRHFLKDLLVG